MAGHSKWAQIKRQKAATDKHKGQAFTRLGRAITIAMREGGGVADPEMNFKLRLAVEKARQANMPKVNIERAIASGAATAGGPAWESLMYEGYGPAGVAVLVEAVTNNRNRTISDLKQVFEKAGGLLGQAGSVGYMFERLGLLYVKKQSKTVVKEGLTEEEAILQLMDVDGVTDVEPDEEEIIVWTAAVKLREVQEEMKNRGFEVVSAELTMKPKIIRELNEEEEEKVMGFLGKLEDLDDVQEVFCDTNV